LDREGKYVEFAKSSGMASLEVVAEPTPGVTEKIYDGLVDRFGTFERNH